MSCTCPTEANTVKNNTVHCEKTENYYFGSEWKEKYLQLNYRTQKKRSADSEWYSDDIIDHVERSYFVDDLQVQTMMNQRRRKRSVKQTMSKEKATEYCRSHIEETKAGRSCKDVSAESIETAMEHCIIDLEVNVNRMTYGKTLCKMADVPIELNLTWLLPFLVQSKLI